MAEMMINLKSNDGLVLSMSNAAAMQSTILKGMIEDDSVDDLIHIDNIGGNALQKVVEYCECHACYSPDELQKARFDEQFAQVGPNVLYTLLMAAYHLKVEGLVDLMTGTVANNIKGKSVTEMRQYFNIEITWSEEEEAALRAGVMEVQVHCWNSAQGNQG